MKMDLSFRDKVFKSNGSTIAVDETKVWDMNTPPQPSCPLLPNYNMQSSPQPLATSNYLQNIRQFTPRYFSMSNTYPCISRSQPQSSFSSHNTQSGSANLLQTPTYLQQTQQVAPQNSSMSDV